MILVSDAFFGTFGGRSRVGLLLAVAVLARDLVEHFETRLATLEGAGYPDDIQVAF